MIRTRDFILYLCVLFFVILMAIATGLLDLRERSLLGVTIPSFTSETAGQWIATTSPTTIDRQSIIAYIREKLETSIHANRDEIAVALPEAPQPEETASTTPVTERSVQYCNFAAVSPLVARWPETVTVREVEGAWQGSHEIAEEVVVGSTTETSTTQEVIFELPIRTLVAPYTTCLPDTLIGVTVAGQPLQNDSAPYAALPSSAIVGYSRDGFIIYGPAAAEELDQCGGRYENGTYQYHVRPSEPFILACYSAIPTPINF